MDNDESQPLFHRIMQADIKHPEVKQRLKEAGSSLVEVARELGVASSTVTIVSQGHRMSHRVLSAIAAKLNDEPEDLWPSRYKN